MYKRIIVAVGDYPECDTPVAYAIALAAYTEAELCLLRVLTVPFVASAPDMVASSTAAMEHLMQANEGILACAMAAADRAGVSYHSLFRWGAFPDMLQQTAEEEDSDLLIVGAPSCPGWRHPLSGYIARKLLARTQRPLLIATTPPPVTYGAPLWSRMLAVHDSSAGADIAVDYAAHLADAEGLDLCVVYAGPSWQLRRSVPLAALDSQLEAEPYLARHTSALAMDYHTVTVPRYDAASLIDVALATQCDAIVLKASHDGGWYRFRHKYVLNTLLASSDLPLLLIPPQGLRSA